MQKLKVNAGFTPSPVRDGDELFPNGIFVFNITRMLEHIQNNTAEISIAEMAVRDIYLGFSNLNEDHIESVDISRPVVFAEIAPGQYNLIDGHHRVEKARRLGKDTVRAYKLTVQQHIPFLTSKKAYLAYVEYWNDKVKQYGG